MYLNGICFITDRTYLKMPLAEALTFVLRAGIRFIQYRDKKKTRRDIYEEAMQLRELTRQFNASLIINDYADIALTVEADGVHLGQEDLPLKEARKIMGKKIIGISTHNISQAKAAEKEGADYIGFGPVFPTATKDAGMPAGVDNLRIIKENVSIPVVAIGGINLDNINAAMNTGVDAFAAATAILRGDISANAARFVGLINEKKEIKGDLT